MQGIALFFTVIVPQLYPFESSEMVHDAVVRFMLTRLLHFSEGWQEAGRNCAVAVA